MPTFQRSSTCACKVASVHGASPSAHANPRAQWKGRRAARKRFQVERRHVPSGWCANAGPYRETGLPCSAGRDADRSLLPLQSRFLQRAAVMTRAEHPPFFRGDQWSPSASMAARNGKEGTAPGWVQARAPAVTASRSVFSGVSPSAIKAAKAPRKASPAPVVSATVIRGGVAAITTPSGRAQRRRRHRR